MQQPVKKKIGTLLALSAIGLCIFPWLTFANTAPRCFDTHLPATLLTTFYYPANLVVTENGLKTYASHFAHLDVINYSSSYYGFLPTQNSFKLSAIAQQNLITLHQFLQQQRSPAKLFLSLGHWSTDTIRQIFFNPDLQQKFIAQIIQVLKQKEYGLSGIDLDWENFFSPHPKETQKFPLFIKNLRTALDAQGLKNICITLDLPPQIVFAKHYPPMTTWATAVDWANVMAYEYYGINPSRTELDATLGTVTTPYPNNQRPHYANTSLVDTLAFYLKAGLPKSKTVVALPFYGGMNYIMDTDAQHYFGLHQKIVDDRSIVTMPYASIYDDYGIFGAPKKNTLIFRYTFQQPTDVKGLHAFWSIRLVTQSRMVGKIYTFISYPDPIAIKEITQFLITQGYRGVSAWELSYDLSFGDPHSLLRSMYDVIYPAHTVMTRAAKPI